MAYYWDIKGRPMNHIEHSAVWLTCEHDTGYGACRDCIEVADPEYATRAANGEWVLFDERDEALAFARRVRTEQEAV